VSNVGRPSLYSDIYCDLLIEHMEKGLSFESFAGAIGVSKQTIYDWTKAHPEFLDAKEVGLEKSRIFWEKLGIKHILNESESIPNIGSNSKSLNASVWIFNMKNRFGWRDKQPEEADHVHVNNTTNQITATPETLTELASLVKSARGEK
jgi:predicted DNA-binding protein YlxM (UPF0122 family)